MRKKHFDFINKKEGPNSTVLYMSGLHSRVRYNQSHVYFLLMIEPLHYDIPWAYLYMKMHKTHGAIGNQPNDWEMGRWTAKKHSWILRITADHDAPKKDALQQPR